MKDASSIGSGAGDEHSFRVAYLVAGFIRNTLTEAENIELDDWVTANMDNQRLFEKLIDEKNLEQGMQQFKSIDAAAALEKIKKSIVFSPVQKKPAVRSLWLYAAAACLVAGLIIVFLLVNNNRHTPSNEPVMVANQPHDIAPGMDRAVLTLSDGRKIGLDSIRNGSLATLGNTHITKLDSGLLSYQAVQPAGFPQPDAYNTLTVPAGGQYRVVLPDGTRVWLNAASSLKYPTVFGGARRTVELTGEGYFEVAKDPMFPFEVKASGATVQVLGTHFNVNAYANEPAVTAVLLEGSVRFNNYLVLKPGEIAAVNKQGNMTRGKADTGQALAWKNGLFVFKEMPIEELMRQVARWYNADVIYQDVITEHFTGEIGRGEPVSNLLHLLEATKRVRFTINRHTITVMK